MLAVLWRTKGAAHMVVVVAFFDSLAIDAM